MYYCYCTTYLAIDTYIYCIYIFDMTLNPSKKLVSIYFEELQYMAFQHLAEKQHRKTADLIREAMDTYLKNQKKNDSFDDWKPFSVGSLKPGAKDWIAKDYQDELLDESCDSNW